MIMGDWNAKIGKSVDKSDNKELMDSAIEMKEGIYWKISVWQMSWL